MYHAPVSLAPDGGTVKRVGSANHRLANAGKRGVSLIYEGHIPMLTNGHQYTVASIPKGNGKYRVVYCVTGAYRKELRRMLPYLYECADLIGAQNYAYAFFQDRNCVLHAFQHIGYNYTLSLDMVDFFDHVTTEHVAGIICEDVIERCFIDGAPRQGLPTSPVIANIAFTKSDHNIASVIESIEHGATYTRYADDMYISFDKKKSLPKIRKAVESIITRDGFILNPQKEKLQSSNNGRVIVTDIGVDENGIYPTRKTKKKLRAAIHQMNDPSANGLREYSLCKFPKRA